MTVNPSSGNRAELVGMARNPVPHGARSGLLGERDGGFIRYALWQASTADHKHGTVCLFSGRGEFIEKYFETITDLRRRGFGVAIMDWRGQGGSSHTFGGAGSTRLHSFAHHDETVRCFMTEVVLPDCPPPYFCLAHSMGAHLVLRLLNMKLCWWDRMVLVSPMIRLANYERQLAVLGGLARAMSLAGLGQMPIPQGYRVGGASNGFADNILTSDRLRYERAADVLKAAPQLRIGPPTVDWVAAAARSIGFINSASFLSDVKLPMLLVAAGNDQIVSTSAIETFASQLKNCRHIVISGARHEILQERDEFREQFWAAFDAFIPGSCLVNSRVINAYG